MAERFRVAGQIVREFGGQPAVITASRPPDDRVDAIAEVIDSWQTAWSLLYAPIDDEPFTPEEAAAADAALERLRQGHGVLLDDIDLVDESESSH